MQNNLPENHLKWDGIRFVLCQRQIAQHPLLNLIFSILATVQY